MIDPSATRSALLDASERLVADHPAMPAGSIIRCFARNVAVARGACTPVERLVEVAETRTRIALARRGVPGQRVA